MIPCVLPEPDPDNELRAALAELGDALANARGGNEICVYQLPAPLAPLEALLARFPHEPASFWEPPKGVATAALGTAVELSVKGGQRFTDLRRQAAELFARVRNVPLRDAEGAPAPRLLGGLAFQVGRAEREPWTEFGDGRFVLPRLSYTRHDARAYLSVTVLPGEASTRASQALLEQARSALAVLNDPSRVLCQRASGSVQVLGASERSQADWAERVHAIRDAIASGRLEKVVLARRVVLTLNPPPDVLQVLDRLRDEAPHTTRFAFRSGAATFLGATPERLLAKAGYTVHTEALAGSQSSGDQALDRELLESRKDLAEHAIVVRELVRTLAPLCSALEYPDRPVLRQLRHLVHLLTPIQGQLREPAHVLDLVEKLHPTPAVGGVPRPDALSWIAEHEPDERGWYAGPIGWFDGAGDGEFAVALRSGVLHGADAYLYVGAGIVEGSHASGEFFETALKLRTLLLGLGVSG